MEQRMNMHTNREEAERSVEGLSSEGCCRCHTNHEGMLQVLEKPPELK